MIALGLGHLGWAGDAAAPPMAALSKPQIPDQLGPSKRNQTASLSLQKQGQTDLALRAQARDEERLKRLQRSDGGSDSGGAQGVFDQRTGRIRFVDILSSEDLQQMNPLENPQSLVFSKFPSCTKVVTKRFYHKAAFQRAFEIMRRFESFFGGHRHDFMTAYHFQYRLMTPFRLKQLRDASAIPASFQIQIALYKDGIAYFQTQALALMPPEEITWIIVKEALRFLASATRIQVTNSEIEEVLRALHKEDQKALAESTYFLKMMRPNFQLDRRFDVERKKAFIETRLKTTDLSAVEKNFWESEIQNIEFFLKHEYEPQIPDRFKAESPAQRDVNTPRSKGKRLDDSGVSGYLPAWAIELGEKENLYSASQISNSQGRSMLMGLISESANEAPRFRVYDLESGETVLNLRQCFQDEAEP